jgi:hypothetical protein
MSPLSSFLAILFAGIIGMGLYVVYALYWFAKALELADKSSALFDEER